ncbi:MAG: flagellar basal body P-ring protein FlgI [Sedimentisphaerales bacterium]|nr:flagellar basal body P-ring protein FlgI [Sedimentisphaerales bacterium]
MNPLTPSIPPVESRRPRRRRAHLALLAGLLAVLLNPAALRGLTRIRDIARPLGERTNKLVGHGFVIGLTGTGDNGESLIAMRPFREMLEKMGNPAELGDLKDIKNIAYVWVTAELGRNGVRDGDTLDVYVHSVGQAKSLEGGTLVLTPLRSAHYADDRLYAWAQGPVSIPSALTPTSGVVKGGAVVESDIQFLFVDHETYPGRSVLTLVLNEDQANWQVAKAVADIINEEAAAPGSSQSDYLTGAVTNQEPTAAALGPKNILVTIPAKQAQNPSPFIARIMNLPVDLPDPEATVVINERTGVIVITGNVEISPVIVTVKDLSIRIVEPEPQPLPGQPVISQTGWSKFDTTESTTVKLQQLIDALDQLNVSVQDKINTIYEINRAGALRANIRREY